MLSKKYKLKSAEAAASSSVADSASEVVSVNERKTRIKTPKRNRLFEEVIAGVKRQENRLRKKGPKIAGQLVGQQTPFKRETETYVDADRAAVVVQGVGDIKRQITRRSKYERINQGTTKALCQEERGDWDVAYKFGLQHMHKKDYLQALANFNLSVAIDNSRPKVVLARSRCQLALGQFPGALADAELVLEEGEDEEVIKAALCKGEALFQLGDFERAAVWFHRHSRLRPLGDQAETKAGLAKSERAIGNALGGDCFGFDRLEECLKAIVRSSAAVPAAVSVVVEKDSEDEDGGEGSEDAVVVVEVEKTEVQSVSMQKKKKADSDNKRRIANRRQLIREMDQILQGKISTDKKFFLDIRQSSALGGEESYQFIFNDAISFIQERQSFWWRYDPAAGSKKIKVD